MILAPAGTSLHMTEKLCSSESGKGHLSMTSSCSFLPSGEGNSVRAVARGIDASLPSLFSADLTDRWDEMKVFGQWVCLFLSFQLQLWAWERAEASSSEHYWNTLAYSGQIWYLGVRLQNYKTGFAQIQNDSLPRNKWRDDSEACMLSGNLYPMTSVLSSRVRMLLEYVNL